MKFICDLCGEKLEPQKAEQHNRERCAWVLEGIVKTRERSIKRLEKIILEQRETIIRQVELIREPN